MARLEMQMASAYDRESDVNNFSLNCSIPSCCHVIVLFIQK